MVPFDRLITDGRDKGIQATMANFNDLRDIQREQRDAMDSIQYHREHSGDVLQRVQLRSGHDQHDIYDNLHSVHISSELSA